MCHNYMIFIRLQNIYFLRKRKLSLPPDPRESRDLRDLFIAKYWKKPTQEQLEELLKVTF